MQKIVISICALIISFNVFSEQEELTKATRLISENKSDEAYHVLVEIIEDKNKPSRYKAKALRLLSNYPLGTEAYSKRHIFANKLFEDQAMFKALKLEDQIFILRTGGLGAFQSAEWNVSQKFFTQIIDLSYVNSNEFKINGAHQDDLGISIEYSGWIKLNQKKYLDAFSYWIKEIKINELSTVWREALIRDHGQLIGEMLFETSDREFENCLLEINQFIKDLNLNERATLKNGLKKGIDRSNYIDSSYSKIVARIRKVEQLTNVIQEAILEDNHFAISKPCFFFEFPFEQNRNSLGNQKNLESRVKSCWDYKNNIEKFEDDLNLNNLYQTANLLALELIKAEIDEEAARYHSSCVLSIQLNDTTRATRTCHLNFLSSKNDRKELKKKSEEIIEKLTEVQDQSTWIGLWDIIFSDTNIPQQKKVWLKRYYPTPESAIKLSNEKGENRPLLWWFENSMNNISNGEGLDPLWSSEFLQMSSPVWKLLKLSSDQKYQAILSLSIQSKNYRPIIENIKDIESSIKNKSNLEKIYIAWLDDYMTNNRTSILNSGKKQSKYYDFWLNSLEHISNIKNLNSDDLIQWKKSSYKLNSAYKNLIPGIAGLLNDSAITFIKIDKIKLNLKSNSFSTNLTKCINLLNKSIKSLQTTALNNPNFSIEAEDLRKEYIKRIIIKIQQIEAPTDWKMKDQELWITEKDKIIKALGGQT